MSVLIVGGGPAGAAAAISLGRAGFDPIVVERTVVPVDQLCGGFLSWNSVRLLHQCGVDPMALGASAIHRFRLCSGGKVIEKPLPFAAAGLSRKRLDFALLDRASEHGAIIRRGVSVRAIDGGNVRFADGAVHCPDNVVLATGKHDVRGVVRPSSSDNPSIGLRWRFPASASLARQLADTIELHLFDHGYAGLVLQEDRIANLCLTVRRSAFVEAGNRPEAVLGSLTEDVPILSERLADEAVGTADAVANIPYGWRARGASGGIYRVGDQIGVIPSLAGEGIAIALTTGLAAADAIIRKTEADRYQSVTSKHLVRPVELAAILWRLAERPGLSRRLLPWAASIPGLTTTAMRLTRVKCGPHKLKPVSHPR